ncbi:MAG: nucleoid occlusion protein, partial [Eubacterium callanderi]
METLTENNLTERHARALLRIPDTELQEEVLKQVIKKDMTVKKTEELVEKIRKDVLTNNYDEK